MATSSLSFHYLFNISFGSPSVVVDEVTTDDDSAGDRFESQAI